MQSEAEQEAAKCIKIAEISWENSDTEKALRFAEKALRLYHSAEAESLIVKIKSGMRAPKRKPAENMDSSPNVSSAAKTKPDPPAKSYTKAQADLCIKVINASTLYEVLGVSQSATDEQIKKAYRKLAMQLHPDKNSAPRAEEAFKKISTAFQVLSNETSRRHYNQTGSADPTSVSTTGHYREGDGGPQFMTPEDLFAAFFFNQMPGHAYRGNRGVFRQEYAHAFRPPQQRNGETVRWAGLLQVLPLLLILVFSFLNSWLSSSSTPDFSLSRTNYATRELRTAEYDIPYFSNGQKFEAEYPFRSRRRREAEAEVEYLYFTQKCLASTTAQRRDFENAKAMGSRRRTKSAYDNLKKAEEQDKWCINRSDIAKRFPVAARKIDSGRSDLFYESNGWSW